MSKISSIRIIIPYAARTRSKEHAITNNPGYFTGAYLEMADDRSINIMRTGEIKELFPGQRWQDVLLMTQDTNIRAEDISTEREGKLLADLAKRKETERTDITLERCLAEFPDIEIFSYLVRAEYPILEQPFIEYPPTSGRKYKVRPREFKIIKEERARPENLTAGYAGYRFFSKFIVYGAINVLHQQKISPAEVKGFRAYRFFWEDLDDQVIVYMDLEDFSYCLFQGTRNNDSGREFVAWRDLTTHNQQAFKTEEPVGDPEIELAAVRMLIQSPKNGEGCN